MVQQSRKLTYDPKARYDVKTTEVVYRDDGQTQWPMTIFEPQGPGPFPALIRAHGGAWNRGERESGAGIDKGLAECGMVVAAIEFRQAPDHVYPAQVQDVNYGIRWLKLHAPAYNIDTACFGVAGDSSGVHTMLLNAMRPNDPDYSALKLEGGETVDASVAYLIGMWGVLDPYTRYFYAVDHGRADIVEHTENYFPTTELMRQANPQMILERGEPANLPPMIIIQGDTDDNIPNYIPLMFVDTYTAAGGQVRIEWFPGMPHRFAKEPGPDAERAIELMRGFVAERIAAHQE